MLNKMTPKMAPRPYKTRIMRSAMNATLPTSQVLSQKAGNASSAEVQSNTAILQVMRFDPAQNVKRIDSYQFEKKQDFMVLDLLTAIKAHQDPTLAFRASCCEGVCGSCAMNINGINSLACITYATNHTVVGPLPNFPVTKDLVVDMKSFFSQYAFIRPFVRNHSLQRYHVDSIYRRYNNAAAALYGVPPRLVDGAQTATSAITDGQGGFHTLQESFEKFLEDTIHAGDFNKTRLVLKAMKNADLELSEGFILKALQDALTKSKKSAFA